MPLLLKCIGAPLGEPVAEDFDFLHRALLQDMGTLLDGGGSSAFWRPVPHQLYYAALGSTIVAHPAAIGALHAALLALGALLLYRTFRAGASGPVAATAASFPLLAESTRTILGWPSQFVDLGLFLFVALALHEASRRRLPTSLLALALALLCKEVAIVAALLLPFVPAPLARADRRRLALGSLGVLVAWGAAYLGVRHAAHLALPHGIESDPQLLATSPGARFGWALRGSLRALLSLPLDPSPHDVIGYAIAAALLALVVVLGAMQRAALRRFAAARPALAWGFAWFALATATLMPIFPLWQPNRSQFGSVGLGLAFAELLAAAHPALLVALVAGRLALLAVAPAPAATITPDAPKTGAFMDFEQLTRLQRFMRETRDALHAAHPTLPPGSHVVEANLPRGLRYALGGDRAIQVWYRDSTLRLVNNATQVADSSRVAAAVVQYQPDSPRQVVLPPFAGVRAQELAFRAISGGQPQAALAFIDQADAASEDTGLVVYRGNNAGLRAFAEYELQRMDDAEREARRAIALYPLDFNGRTILATILVLSGRLDQARPVLESLLRTHPGDASVLKIAARFRDEETARASAHDASPGR